MPQSQPKPSEDPIHLFFERGLDLFLVAGFDGYFTSLNARWEQVLGFAREELKREPFLYWVHPEDREAALFLAERLAAGGQELSFDTRFRCASGDYRWLRWSLRGEPETRTVFGTARDITASRSEGEMYRLALQAAPSGVLMVNELGRIVMANPTLEALFGYGEGALLGLALEVLVPNRVAQSHQTWRRRYQLGPEARPMGAGRDLFGRRRDGTEFPIEIGLSPVTIDDRAYVLSSVIDLTERKRNESELHARVTELQQRRTDQMALGEMSSLLQHASKPEEAHQIVQTYCESLFPDVPIGIFVFGQARTFLELVAACHAFEGPPTVTHSDCWALRRSHPHRARADSPTRCPHSLPTAQTESLCIPMAAHGLAQGVLCIELNAAQQPNADTYLALGRAVADQLGLSLRNLELHQRLTWLSVRDPLTSLYNRRYLEEVFERELARSRRQSLPLSVVMMDVDHFKRINDSEGHAAGDRVLVELSHWLQAHSRQEDIICRFGGEEFVALLPNTAQDHAFVLAERLRQQWATETGGRVTLSLGVATSPRCGTTWEDLIRSADRSVYAAKAAGRNCVKMEKADEP